MPILKVEAFAGMSGDMFLGALAELADGHDLLQELPRRLGLEDEAEVRIQAVEKNGIACKHVRIIDKQHAKAAPAQAKHHHDHGHDHDHGHGHGHHHHHRHLADIHRIIDEGDLPTRTKSIAKAIFQALGKAESEVHGIPLERIHFHEVGAIDSIMDIVGAAWLIDRLRITATYCGPVSTGYGFAQTEHGRLPIPCPATQRLLLGVPTRPGDQEGELTTPTGAAILRYLDPTFSAPVLVEEKVGYGPGEKELEIPNVLRLSLCRAEADTGEVVVLEAQMDDASGEELGAPLQEALLQHGALDLMMQQVIMKKGRPGILLTVLARPEAREDLARFILAHTPTIGLRFYAARRVELKREERILTLPEGEKATIKVVRLPDGSERMKPAYDDLHRLAGATGRPIDALRHEIWQQWEQDRQG